MAHCECLIGYEENGLICMGMSSLFAKMGKDAAVRFTTSVFDFVVLYCFLAVITVSMGKI